MPSETISNTVTDGVEDPPVGNFYEWESGYDISMPDNPEGETCKVTITVKIHLEAQEGVTDEILSSRKEKWKENIEDVWSGAFKVCLPEGSDVSDNCPCKCFKVDINVEWEDSADDAHHTVKVKPGPSRSNMLNWDTKDGYEEGKPNVAAHEFGHMLGLKDEYADTANAPERELGDADSLMRSSGGEVKKSHFEFIADWVNSKREDCNYEVK
jgi:hypothetical protein